MWGNGTLMPPAGTQPASDDTSRKLIEDARRALNEARQVREARERRMREEADAT